jgi:hypothetical protein
MLKKQLYFLFVLITDGLLKKNNILNDLIIKIKRILYLTNLKKLKKINFMND